jgi:hypothetical protein
MLKVSASLVDGGALDWDVPDAKYAELVRLRHDGYEGMALIHELFTDDWGAPPMTVRLYGTMDDGTAVDESIPYR